MEYGDWVGGYFTPDGYEGIVDGQWMLFASEEDYYDYVKENES